ncbi:aspartic proteinase-like protein 2, partial [Tanacetum coccineum]
YYTTRLWIGTPPQKFELIVDTGSTATYVPCSTCQQCGKHQDPKFDPESSDSYEPMKCNVDCTCDSKKKQCVYERQYAEMSSSKCLECASESEDPKRKSRGGNSPYYNIELKELHVAGKRLPLKASVFDGKHGTFYYRIGEETVNRKHDQVINGFYADRLHPSGGPSPSPDGSNSSADTPSSSPPYHISPGSKVGNIIFYMSLNIKYSKLEPQIMELTQFIAMELDVNVSQNIIARIAEDEIHLPKSFGKHRISNWYIESEPNRRQPSIPYKPVDSAVSEQELQPL